MNIWRVICWLALAGIWPGGLTAAEKGPIHEQEMMQERLQEMEGEQFRHEERERVFGWELMSAEERRAHRQTMRSFRTAKERDAYRRQHHARMKKRAEEAGLKIQELSE